MTLLSLRLLGAYLPSGCPRRFAAATSSGCTGWAARRPRTAGFLSRPGWARPWCRPYRSSSLLRRVLRSGPPYLRAFEQLYKKPNNREKKLHLFISAFRKALVLYDTDNDGGACSSALHQMGLKTKKHDFGARITFSTRVAQSDWLACSLLLASTTARCSRKPLRTPSLTPVLLLRVSEPGRVGHIQPAPLISGHSENGKKQSERKPTLSDQGHDYTKSWLHQVMTTSGGFC